MVQMAGQTICCRITGDQTGGAMAVLETTLEPGLLGAPPHMHRYEDEVTVVLAGQLMVQLGERVVHVAAGEFVFKPRGVCHTFWNPGPTAARCLEFISPSGFEEYFPRLARLFPPGEAPDIPGAVALARQYAVDYDLDRAAEIQAEHGVKAAWLETAKRTQGHKEEVQGVTVEGAAASYHGGTASSQARTD